MLSNTAQNKQVQNVLQKGKPFCGHFQNIHAPPTDTVWQLNFQAVRTKYIDTQFTDITL